MKNDSSTTIDEDLVISIATERFFEIVRAERGQGETIRNYAERIGVSSITLWKWLNNEHGPRLSNVALVLARLGYSIGFEKAEEEHV